MTSPAGATRQDRGARIQRQEPEHAIVGQSPLVVRALRLARKFAQTELPILLVGATGTGKELFAQCIHHWSGCAGNLVDVNCGALPREMVESLLFGHRRGAFTGAVEGIEGLVAAAEGGTLFLDELSSLALEAQVKLLRVLDTGHVRRLGETGKRRVRFRVVAAVQEDFEIRVQRGEFRLDLYQRVAGLVLRLPALEERCEDCWPLALHFARERGLALAVEAQVVVERYGWPGNVRELRLAVERAGFLAEGGSVGAVAMAEAIELGAPGGAAVSTSLLAERQAAEARRCEIEAMLARHRGDTKAVAIELGVSRSTVYRRLHDSELDPGIRGRYR